MAVWKLPVLKHDLTLTGEVVADIYAATTGTDNDMVVKLIDEYPGRRSGREDARLPVDDQYGNLPRPVSVGFETADGAARRRNSRVQIFACTMWTTSSRPGTR